MIKIVIDDKIPFIRGILDAHAAVSYLPPDEITPQRLKDVDALIIRTRTRCNAQLLDGTAVRFIASATIGYDHIDTDYCHSHGITWTNAAGCNASSVAQYMLAALLELADKRSFSLKGKMIGIVGIGNVGSQLVRVAEVLGMKTMLCDPPRVRKEGLTDFVSLAELLATSDIVSLHVSLTRQGEDRTFGLADARFFSQLKKDVIFINASRGEVVEELALKNAIRNNHISDAVLDVWCNEPNIDYELMEMATIATPHIAGYSADGKANGTAMSVQAVSRFFGLGLDSWKPAELPNPANKLLSADFSMASWESVLRSLVKATYSIMEDDARLRMSPADFEQQRGSYPLRREFGAFTVEAKHATDEDRQRLTALGFRLLPS